MNLLSKRTTTKVYCCWTWTLLLSLCALSASALEAVSTTTSKSYASSRFKAPNTDTPSDLIQQWQTEDDELWDYVNSHVPAVLDHTGSAAFDEHLKGVQAVLRYWNSPNHLTKAGLFHSIYGTEGFQGFALPLSERSTIQKLIGKDAERLCFWFCMVDRSTFDTTILDWQPSPSKEEDDNKETTIFRLRSRPELGRFEMNLNKEEWLDFIELTLADWLEQVEGAATKPSDLFLWKTIGEAYAYRRLAYRKMSEILSIERSERLSIIPKQMLMEVMETEGNSTRHLIQPRTPPMSPAASAALDALRASGEDIPIDLSPQPMSDNAENLTQSKTTTTTTMKEQEL
eukprot:scaffold5322_cov88-Cylindrotheca_fusiformis.AAC.2